jgi:hypothetical protein
VDYDSLTTFYPGKTNYLDPLLPDHSHPCRLIAGPGLLPSTNNYWTIWGVKGAGASTTSAIWVKQQGAKRPTPAGAAKDVR